MFQSVRINTPLYILHKGDNPILEIGYVVNQPKPKYSNTFGQEVVVDLIVKINEQTVNYNNLPAQSDIADSYINGENIVVSDNKDIMNAEIINLKQKSTDIINSVDIHKNLISKYDELLTTLNPDFAEKQAQKNDIDNLKQEVQQMSKSLTELMTLLKQKGD